MKLSIKTKVNLWFTVLMMVVVGIILGFMILISDRVAESISRSELESVVSINAEMVSYENAELMIDDDFLYYTNGINTLIYSVDFNFVAGQRPTGYDKSQTPFRNGLIQKSIINGKDHYVYDSYVYFGKNNGVWLRGIIEIRESASFINSITGMAVVVLPLLVVLASVVGYIISVRAFRPVKKIITAANEIKDGSDLSARIDLGERKDEIYYLAETFDKMFERLEVSFLAEREFASNASHELRTPLSVISAECKYLEGTDDIEEYKESVAVIKRQTDKMTELVNKLLQITRLEQGTYRLSYENVNLSMWIQSLCESYDNNYMNVKIIRDIADNVFIDVDIALFGTCLDNLMDNGIKYNKDGGFITVAVDEDDEYVYISFSDTGAGIAEENLVHIFNRFYREDTSRSENSFGLGLFLTKQIVELHGGRINAESVKGVGSRFEIKMSKKRNKKLS